MPVAAVFLIAVILIFILILILLFIFTIPLVLNLLVNIGSTNSVRSSLRIHHHWATLQLQPTQSYAAQAK